MFYFVCIVLPFLDIFLIFLPSPVLSGLFLQVVLLFFSSVAFSSSPQHVPAFFPFIIFASFRRFIICVSSQISHPGFDFFSLFVLFKGTPIFSQTNFAPA